MLPTWFWVLLWAVMALGALAVLALLGLRVWRKFWALTGELAVVGDRAGELGELLARIELPESVGRWDDAGDGPWEDDEPDSGFTAARRVNADQPT